MVQKCVLVAIESFGDSPFCLKRIVKRNVAVTVSLLHIFESETLWSTVAFAFHTLEHVGLGEQLAVCVGFSTGLFFV
jgi:hypothetical protein